jgi:Xaa-Pro dipeptidase
VATVSASTGETASAPGTSGGLAGAEAGRDAGEVGRRLDTVRGVIEERGAGGALLSSRRNFAWLTLGGENHVVVASETGVAAILVTRDDAVALSPNIEADRIHDEELGGLPLEVASFPWWEPDAIEAEARRRTDGSLLGDADLEPALVPLRSRLTPLEHDRMAEIGRRAAAALGASLDALEGGETEDDLAADLAARLPGLRAPVLLVAADERIDRYRHPIPAGRPIRRRVMLVIVAERWGLHVAATRFRELEPPSPELAWRIAATRDVERALHEATRPGATLGEVLAAGQAAYAAAGVPDEWQRHHQGGTIGYQGRERVAVPNDPTPVEAGMAFAWNPSITGAKAEDTFVLGPDGARRSLTG